jgi:PST family polysaccharide transporter
MGYGIEKPDPTGLKFIIVAVSFDYKMEPRAKALSLDTTLPASPALAGSNEPQILARADFRNLLRPVESSRTGPLIRKGAVWSLLAITGRYLANMATTVVLARLLLPADYGLLAMAGALLIIMQVFADLGLSWATVRTLELSRETLDSCWWVNTTFGFALLFLCTIAAHAVSTFYGRPELQLITIILGINFVLTGAAVQPKALLQRQLDFREIAFVELSALVIGNLCGIALALNGFGYWSLVAQSVTMRSVLLILYLLRTRYRPHAPKWRSGIRVFLQFGGYMAAFNIVIFFARNFDNVIVGKLYGAEQAGYYSRAHFLLTLPSLFGTGALASVLVPGLSALQSDLTRLANVYRSAVSWMCFVCLPLTVGLAILSSGAVRLVYGPRWAPVVPLLCWLSIGGIGMPIQQTAGWLFVSTGHTRNLLLTGFVMSGFTGCAVVLGAHWGMQGIAAAFGLATLISTVPMLYFAHRSAGIPLLATCRTVVPFLVAAIAIWPSIYLCSAILTPWRSVTWPVALLLKSVTGSIGYILTTAVLAPQLWSDLLGRVRQWLYQYARTVSVLTENGQ